MMATWLQFYQSIQAVDLLQLALFWFLVALMTECVLWLASDLKHRRQRRKQVFEGRLRLMLHVLPVDHVHVTSDGGRSYRTYTLDGEGNLVKSETKWRK